MMLEENEIDIYIQKILKKQLSRLKFSNYGLYSIIENVKSQLNSIIKHWNDTDFINAIFCTVIEEGHFYEPYINDKIGNLVVLGIRNSLLEIAASVDYKRYGLKNPLSNKDIKLITSSAIEYFKDIDIDSLSKKISMEDDYYYDIVKKYNVTYDALVKLGNCSSDNLEIEFEKYNDKPYVFDEILNYKDVKNIGNVVKTITNGISDELPDALIKLLKGILDKESSLFYVDSFKYLSRNFELNLKVLQLLITNNAMFLTNNFLITNGYVSRRNNIVRSSHGNNFNIDAIESIGDVSKKYKNKLESLF